MSNKIARFNLLVCALVLMPAVWATEASQGSLGLLVEHVSDEAAQRDGSASTAEGSQARLGAGYDWQLNDKWQLVSHLSGRYSSEQAAGATHSGFFQSLSSEEGLAFGEATVDNLHFSYRRIEGKQVQMGRMQVNVVLPGVSGNSLSRSDSAESQVTWSDGLRFSFKDVKGWQNQVLIAYTPASGPTTVQRAPLDFRANSTRTSYFFASDKQEDARTWYLSGFTFTYLPSALCQDGVAVCGNRGDYLALVMRQGWQWPVGSQAGKLLLGLEAGLAPHTPPDSVMNLPGTDDADGSAWQVALDLMNFAAGHSVGVVHGRADSGWLISPSYRNNSITTELRYRWEISPRHALTLGLSEVEDAVLPLAAVQLQNETRSLLRYDWKL